MRTIAITKKCTECEKKLIMSTVQEQDSVLFFDDEEELKNSKEIEQIDIIFGEPAIETIRKAKSLRWIQMSWAGVNQYTSIPDFPTTITVTNASGAYGNVISEYVVSGLLLLIRQLPTYMNQIRLGGWEKIAGDDTLEGKRALILGTGNIGQETAKKLKCFGVYTIGMCRTAKENVKPFDEVYTIDKLDEKLGEADIVIIALPGTEKTRNLFDTERIQLMRESAILVNVGRGFIVDTETLMEALKNKRLRGAVLDVTNPEPLPEQHPLRKMNNVLITPHISGITWGENMFTRKRIVEIFCKNIVHDTNHEIKENVIDFARGY